MNGRENTSNRENRDSKLRLRTILISLVAGIAILFIKLYAAKISNASALRSDALEGMVNVLAAAVGLYAILFSEKPADRDHPYGHGKIEYFSSGFEGGLIALAGVLIIFDTTLRLVNHSQIENLGDGILINALGGILNGALGTYILFSGKRFQSQTLIADGQHLLSDFYTTIALGAGLGLSLYTGWTWIDPFLAYGAAAFLLWTGFKLLRTSLAALLDAENPELLEQIVAQLNKIDRGKIITVHELRAQNFGRDQHIDIHLVFPEFLPVKEAHHAADRFADLLKSQLSPGSLIHTHIDPCGKNFCKECPLSECPIRVQPFQKQKVFTLATSIKPGEI